MKFFQLQKASCNTRQCQESIISVSFHVISSTEFWLSQVCHHMIPLHVSFMSQERLVVSSYIRSSLSLQSQSPQCHLQLARGHQYAHNLKLRNMNWDIGVFSAMMSEVGHLAVQSHLVQAMPELPPHSYFL